MSILGEKSILYRKPEKYNTLLEHIEEVKETYPKPEE